MITTLTVAGIIYWHLAALSVLLCPDWIFDESEDDDETHPAGFNDTFENWPDSDEDE